MIHLTFEPLKEVKALDPETEVIAACDTETFAKNITGAFAQITCPICSLLAEVALKELLNRWNSKPSQKSL